MAGLFDLLNTVIGKITQNNVTYATAPTPPDGDSSTKVATTAFVADKTAAISSGNVAVWSRDFTVTYTNSVKDTTGYLKAPTGGTWFCFGSIGMWATKNTNLKATWESTGTVISGGGTLQTDRYAYNYTPVVIHNNSGLAIKIA